MNNFGFLNDFLIEGYESWSLSVLALTAILFLIQIYYYAVRYARIASFHNPNIKNGGHTVPVSVIIPVFQADFNFLQNVLPGMLAQTLDKYEVVIVDVTGDDDFSEQLKLLRITNPDRFNFTRLRADPLFPISTKMALNVGIKAAAFEHLVFTTVDCRPNSDRWLEILSKGFSGGEVVLGYAGVASTKGLENRLVRCSNVAVSVRWISQAMYGRPFRGTLCNLGFTKSVYFAAKGFNYLSLNMGEDDLFVMKIASAENTNIIVNGAATVSQTAWGGLKWWRERRRKLSYTYRYYPLYVKSATSAELWSRAMFFVLAALLLCTAPMAGKIFAASALLLRLAIVMLEMKRICRRMSERRLLSMYPVYDLFAPLAEARLAIERSLTPKHKWR